MTDRTAGPPISHPLSEELPGRRSSVTLPWAEFFNNVFEGDGGTKWTPVFTNLTEAGGPATIAAYYSRINQNIALFNILIDPATSVSSTAGNTYVSGFPLTFLYDSFCIAVSGGLGALPGHIVAANGRIYLPAIAAVTVPITIIGVGFAR